MEVDSVDLKTALASAKAQVAKISQARVTDWLKVKLVELHNARMKLVKLEADIVRSRTNVDGLTDLVRRVEAGDWEAVEPLDIASGEKKERPEDSK